MKIDKKYLLGEAYGQSFRKKDDFESPLYNSVNPQPTKVPENKPQIGTVKPEGGNYTTSFEYNPTVQQRLRLNSGDTSLSAKERGVPTDQSEELVGKMQPRSKGSWIYNTRTVFNPNYAKDLAASSAVAPSMVNISTTYYDRVFKPNQQQD